MAGNAAEKTRKLYQSKVDAINALEPSMQALSDEALRAKTKELQDRYQDGQTLDALLPEAFAVRPPCCAPLTGASAAQKGPHALLVSAMEPCLNAPPPWAPCNP